MFGTAATTDAGSPSAALVATYVPFAYSKSIRFDVPFRIALIACRREESPRCEAKSLDFPIGTIANLV